MGMSDCIYDSLEDLQTEAYERGRSQREEIERLHTELETEIARNRPLRALVSSLETINSDFRQRIKELTEAGNTLESEREANAVLSAENAELRARLTDIGDFAHARSTGPAIEDDLWEVRRMAYDL